MNDPATTILFQKIYVILHRSLVETRNLALGQNCQQIHDLADTFEIIPSLLNRWEDSHLEFIQNLIAGYQAKYKATAYDYLSILNMNDNEFQEVFQLNPVPVPG